MNIFSEKLVQYEDLEKKVEIICSYNNLKCEFIQGRILNVEATNISFIEPHRIIIKIKNEKLLLIYYDKHNLFLYNRYMPLDIKQLDTILKSIKGKVL